jgi:hypothetical protein
LAAKLRLRSAASGDPFTKPSILFTCADFDTEHDRDPSLAPKHGHIRVAHLFLSFGYSTSTQSSTKAKKLSPPKAAASRHGLKSQPARRRVGGS